MIDLYFWPTPNGKKISVALEELGLPYRVVPVDIGRGAQNEAEFVRISPNHKMPAIVDDDGPEGAKISVFESAAILQYLGEKTGHFLPKAGQARYDVLAWLAWQVAGLGPMAGQYGHFTRYAPTRIEYGVERYGREVDRLYGVLDARLEGREFVAGELSVADFAIYPWILPEHRAWDRARLANLTRWHDAMGARPGVQRGMAVGAELSKPLDAEAKKVLFGQGEAKKG